MRTAVENINDLKRFKNEFVELVNVVRRADGKYVLYVDTVQNRSPATQSIFITKSQFDAALSPAMRSGRPHAFSRHVAGGRFTPHRLDAAYSAYQRAQAKAELETNLPGSAIIRSRDQYLAVYGDSFRLYPPGKLGDFLNMATQQGLRGTNTGAK